MNSNTSIRSRRDFLKQSATAMTALSAMGLTTGHKVWAQSAATKTKMRVALVGTGHRGMGMWGTSLAKDYAQYVQMVGLCDINSKRVKYAEGKIEAYSHYPIPYFTDFDEMVRTTQPDSVIVATTDCYHAQYVIRAMELGCNVICEKPFGVTAEQCRQMAAAEKKYNKHITVTFNFRYFPFAEKVKQLVTDGEIGQVNQINYQEFLGLSHGSSYFRRWHGYKKYSGTLLCTKASHHFDVVNWWLGADPVEVFAYGALNKFGKAGPFRYTHCRGCPHKNKCDFYWDITTSKKNMEMYVNCESEDGYLRDGCVFRKDMDTPDTNSVLVKYDNGVQLNYTLTAMAPYEGQQITIQGSQGRLIARIGDQPWKAEPSDISLTKNHQDPVTITLEEKSGGHSGADPSLKNHLFIPDTSDPLSQRAGSRAGIMSSIIGIAGYTSVDTGSLVKIKDLL